MKILLDKSNQLNNTLNMPETAQKQSKAYPDPIITDLNMAYALEVMKGKTQAQVAKEFGVTPAAVSLGIKRVRELTGLKGKGEIADPVNSHRARLIKRLRKTEKVYDEALKSGKVVKDGKIIQGWKTDFRRLDLAVKTSLALDKGLGVLVERTEHTAPIDALQQQREDMDRRVQAAKQFGLNVKNELPTVQVEVSNDVQAVEPDSNDKHVSRETSAPPDITPTT